MTQMLARALRVPSSRRLAIGMTVCLAAGFSLSAAMGASAPQIEALDGRIRGAERILVATVQRVTPAWHTNPYGDRLIVSRIELSVAETLKGESGATAWMEMEGGSLDGLTLRVSSLPALQVGERAVFFLESRARGMYAPFMRGEGILTLDESDGVRGGTLRLDDIRSRAQSLGR